MKFSSTNPMLNVDRIASNGAPTAETEFSGLMTLQGTAQKSIILIVLCLVSSVVSYTQNDFTQGAAGTYSTGLFVGAMIVALIAYLVGIFATKFAFICSPIYAIAEGVCLGYISARADTYFPGAALSALLGTIAVFGVMFTGFSMGWFKVTQKFKTIVLAIAFGYLIFMLIELVLNLCGLRGVGYFNLGNHGFIVMAINALAIILASVFLLLDFDNIASLHGRVTKDYEWVCGMGLLATLIWLYLELLRMVTRIAIMINDNS